MKSMKEHEEEDETPNTCAPNAAKSEEWTEERAQSEKTRTADQHSMLKSCRKS